LELIVLYEEAIGKDAKSQVSRGCRGGVVRGRNRRRAGDYAEAMKRYGGQFER
jgi:hypothetical protein